MIDPRFVAAALCAVAALALGAAVAHRPPGALDLAALALRGHGVGAAVALTAIGRGFGTTVVGALAILAALAARSGVRPVVAVVVAQVLSQAVNAGLKFVFARSRPLDPVGRPDQDLSFPSGHATTAVVLFVGLAIVAFHELPRPWGLPVAVLLAATGVAIAWSRLALGAHWATDVIAGALLGTAWLCLALGVAYRPSIASTITG